MEAMAQEWTDGRLDDLSKKVDQGFEHADSEARALRLEMRTEFTQLRSETQAGFARIDARLDSMQRTMIQGVIAMAAATLAGFSGIIVLIATQL
jgi:hypothetical protein